MRLIKVRLACMLTATTILVTTAGCSGSRDGHRPAASPTNAGSTQSTAGSAQSNVTAPASTPPSLGLPRPIYAMVKHPCDSVTFTAFTALLGERSPGPIPDSSNILSGYAAAHCSRTFGPPGSRSVVLINTQRSEHGAADGLFEGLHHLDATQTGVTDLPGVGEGAYIRVKAGLGTSLTVYDNNLFAQITVLLAPPSTQPGLTDALKQVALELLNAAKP